MNHNITTLGVSDQLSASNASSKMKYQANQK